MVVYERGSWLTMVLRIHGSVVKQVWPRLLVVLLVSCAFTYVQTVDERFHFSLTVTPFLLTALPLGIILGFRNSASYDRFWEGRKLWGSLVNASRSIVRQLDTYVVPKREEDAEAHATFRRETGHRVIAVARALAKHLRGEKDFGELAPLVDEGEAAKLAKEPSPPSALLHRMGADLRRAGEAGWLSERHAPMLEASLVTLTEVVGACERIKNTPTPVSYIIFIHRAVAIYCMLLPFGVADSVHRLTPVVCFFVSYALFSLDAIGDELDDPFRRSPNGLPLTAIARNIEIYVRLRLGEEDVPKVLAPVDGVLD